MAHWTAYMVISFMICISMHKIEVISTLRNRHIPVYDIEQSGIITEMI